MAAGTDTTAHLITMCVYFLLRYPEQQVKLREEIQKFVPETKTDGYAEVSHEALSQMKYLHAFIREILRLYPTSSFLFDLVAGKDHTLGGITILQGTVVMIPIFALGHNSNFYKNPTEFRPERWINEDEVKKIDPFAELGFSAGSRNCIGQHLARIEAKLVLIKLLSAFKLSFSNPNYKLRMGLMFLVQPVDTLLIDLQPQRLTK